MKIALFHNLPAGGAKRSLGEWLAILKEDNVIDFFGYKDLSPEFCTIDKYINKQFTLYENPKKGNGILNKIFSILKSEYYSIKISRKINAGGYDLAFILQCEITNSPPILRRLKIKKFYYCQEPLTRMKEPHYHSGSGKKNNGLISRVLINLLLAYDRFNARRSDIIFCNSYYSKETIYKAYGVYPKLIYLGVNADHFQENKTSTKTCKYLLSVGHLNSAKGHDFIIESISYVKEEIRPALKIVYNIENIFYKKFLINLAIKCGVELILIKSPSDSNLVDIYNNAYLLLCAARLEPFGLSPLEAMACGTPVLAVAEAGYRETVIDGKVGVLVERLPEEMAAAIMRLIADEGEYQFLRGNCRQYVIEKWLWDRSANALAEQLVF